MSEQIKDGGQAFPARVTLNRETGELVPFQFGNDAFEVPGMTLRDYFAAKAMQSFMQGAVLPVGFNATEELAFVAGRAYETADAMLAAREAQS